MGDPELDHQCWERPETTAERRPHTQVNASFPGTGVAAETTAAMASASIIFRKLESTYSSLLLTHSQSVFVFADTHQGSYSASIPRVQQFYNSSRVRLYLAAGDGSYLSYVTVGSSRAFTSWGMPGWFSWDDKHHGVQVSQVFFSLVHLLEWFVFVMSHMNSNGLVTPSQVLLS